MSETTPAATNTGGFEDFAGQTGSPGLITSASMVTLNYDRPFATKQIGVTQTSEDELKRSYRLLSPELKKTISAKLKASGYKVPITDAFDLRVREAWLDANRRFSEFASDAVRSDPEFFTDQPFTIDDYLSLSAQGVSTAGGVKTYTTVYSEEKAADLVDTIFKDLTGMPASDEDKMKYSAILREKQMETPSTYNPKTGLSVQGMDAAGSQKMLIDQIAGTDEAKRMRAMSGYQILLSQLGVSI